MTKTATHVPAGLTAVTPYLLVPDGAGAIDFYQTVFGATEIMRHEEGGQVVHAKLRIADAPIELGQYDDRPSTEVAELPGVGLHLYVEDVDSVLEKATAAGGRTLVPIQDQPYGDREVTVADPFGVVWFVATHLHD